MTEKTALHLLKMLFVALFAVGIAARMFTVRSQDGSVMIVPTVLGLLIVAAVWATAYHFISNGSWIARLLTTLTGSFSFVSNGLQVAAYGRRASILDLIVAASSMALIAMILTLINIPPIRGLKRPAVVSKPRPAGDTVHEHNWQPHSVLDDWVRCSGCGQMHLEPGTVALVNQSSTR
jgi:hypothetical protein